MVEPKIFLFFHEISKNVNLQEWCGDSLMLETALGLKMKMVSSISMQVNKLAQQVPRVNSIRKKEKNSKFFSHSIYHLISKIFFLNGSQYKKLS